MVDDSNDPFNSHPVLEKIANRCVPYGIDCILDNGDVPHGPASIYLVWEEEGIDTAQIVDGPHARFAASVPFERYKESFQGYRAMWSPTYRIVECNVEPYDEEDRVWSSRADYTKSKEAITRNVLQMLGFDVDEDEDLKPSMRVILEAGDGVAVSVGCWSDRATRTSHSAGTKPSGVAPPTRSTTSPFSTLLKMSKPPVGTRGIETPRESIRFRPHRSAGCL